MAPRLLGLLLLLCLFVHPILSFSGQISSFESVPDLENSMYMAVDGSPCVRLLNISGEIGCSNPGTSKVVAPIVRLRSAEALVHSSAVLLSADDFPSFFARLSNDSDFASSVVGVLVESGSGFQNVLAGLSPDDRFPQSKFAPYHNFNYEWNPTGSGILWNAYNFPMFLLSANGTLALEEVAAKNSKREKMFTTDVVEFDLVMQTTKSGTRNSESCLIEGTCLPLGGYSVWSSLPPINVSSLELPKPVILVVASMDSASLFRDKSLGAESPISGLISLLAAVDALSHLDVLNYLNKQLVFLVFTGEAWGYLGSRRFLHELDLHTDSVYGLNSTLIETVMEIGSVGKASRQGVKQFFAHATGTSSAANDTLKALKRAQDSLKSEGIKISTANTSNPGVPPSSLMAFLRKSSQTSGVVIEDFDTVFTNTFYHGHLDNSSNIESSAIAAAATLVARSLYILASDNKDSAASVSNITANASLVDELIGCLLNCDPGLSCGLVTHYISPQSICPNNYAGVVLGEPSSTPHLGYVGDVSRFLWNFLADRTSAPSNGASSSCPQNCSKTGEVCIRAEIDGKGDCVISTTRYVPAYSTRLKFESGSWVVLPPNSTDAMGMIDPIWTESNWDTIGLRVYAVQDVAYDRVILLLGIGLTAVAYGIVAVTKPLISKALKQD